MMGEVHGPQWHPNPDDPADPIRWSFLDIERDPGVGWAVVQLGTSARGVQHRDHLKLFYDTALCPGRSRFTAHEFAMSLSGFTGLQYL